MREIGWFAIIGGAIVLEVFTAPGTALNGQEWKVSRSQAPGMVHFTVERSRPGRRSSESSDAPLANFRGFSLSMLDHSGPAKFEYVHDAGTLVCEGKFAWGRGSGSFTMKPNPEFVAELNRLGFASPHDDDLFVMMLANVDLDFAREVRASDVHASLSDLIELRTHGVILPYIQDLNRAGIRNLRAQDYIELRDHGVKTRFVEELRQAGYSLPPDQIVELASHGIDSAYVRDVQFYGLRPSEPDLVDLHAHGVSPAYLKAVSDTFGPLSADAVIEMHAHGVPVELAREARDLGYHFTTVEIVDLHAHGVTAQYLRNLHNSGMQNLTEPQITQLHAHGVD